MMFVACKSGFMSLRSLLVAVQSQWSFLGLRPSLFDVEWLAAYVKIPQSHSCFLNGMHKITHLLAYLLRQIGGGWMTLLAECETTCCLRRHLLHTLGITSAGKLFFLPEYVVHVCVRQVLLDEISCILNLDCFLGINHLWFCMVPEPKHVAHNQATFALPR